MEEQAAEQGTAAEVVVVRLGGARYALPMAVVAEVGRPPQLTRVPGLPAWVAGLANWRGRVLPVLDLRPLLGGAALAATHGRLVVLHVDGVRVGLVTEGVDGSTALDLERLDAPPAHLPPSAAGLLAGQRTDDDGPLAVLEPAAVLGLSAQLPRVRRAG